MVIALMLAVVALASTQPAFAPNESGSIELSNQDWIGDAATIFAIGLVVLGLLGLVLALIFSGTKGGEPPPQKRSLISQIMFVVAVFLAARFGLFDRLRAVADAFAPPNTGEAAGGLGPLDESPSEEVVSTPIRDIDLVSSLALALLFVLLLVLLGWWNRRGVMSTPNVTTSDETEALRADLSRAGALLDDDSLDDRQSVLACYEAMETTMAEHGVARRSYETPEDFLARTRDHLGTERSAAETLTELVNHALYDATEVTSDHRRTARTALDDLVQERSHVD